MIRSIASAFIFTLLFSSSAFGEIGWCGNVYPNDGDYINESDDLTIYFQIWKDGVTDADSSMPGEGIFTTMNYRIVGESAWTEMEMTYNTDVGNNDEFMVTIAASELNAGDNIEVYCEGLDMEDTSTCQGNDQEGSPATEEDPLTYYVIAATAIDVTIHFSVDMTWIGAVEPVIVAGTFNDWDSGEIVMHDYETTGIFEAEYTIPAGESKYQFYKYINGGTWEWEGSMTNRELIVDDSSDDQYLDMDYWEDRSIADRYIIFRVDMSSVEPDSISNPYIAGNQPPLHWGWDDAWTDDDRIYDDGTHMDEEVGNYIYTTIIEFPAGTFMDVEYKYTTNGLDNEPLPPYANHEFRIPRDIDTLWLPIDIFGELDNITIDVNNIPDELSLSQNRPNPFNSATIIEFSIGRRLDNPAVLAIYDLGGNLIRTLAHGVIAAGTYGVAWSGRDYIGDEVPSGTYICILENGDFHLMQKMLFIK